MAINTLERLSRLLQQLKEEQSNAEFARQIGKPTSTVHNWLKGETTPEAEFQPRPLPEEFRSTRATMIQLNAVAAANYSQRAVLYKYAALVKAG